MANLLGRYEIQEEIGRGGFAIVYRARDTELERLVALKELHPGLLQDTAWVERFKREARTIARLDHPRIVTIHDVVEIAQRLFIVMRLVDGSGLDNLLATQGRLPWPQTVAMMAALAEALDYAHAQGILHRDLKPANILLDAQRGPLLSDFGLAKLVSDHSLSQSSSIVGTPHYIAPEVWEGQSATRQADIYALGCILFEMLTGQKLFGGDSPPAVMMAHFNPLKLPDTWPKDVPPGIVDILQVALSKGPHERYPAATKIAAAMTSLTKSTSQVGVSKSAGGQNLIENPKSTRAGYWRKIENRHNLPAQTTPFIGRETGARMEPQPKILIVDDTPKNIKLLEAVLMPRGYALASAGSGPEALERVAGERPDLVLLDIVMPGMDGYEVCRRLREDPATHLLPVVMITASGEQEKVKAIEAGADDFIPKPFNQAELLARVKSLLRIKQYYDTIQTQAAELAEWNRSLETRVQQQVEELERLNRLRRFLSPQLADAIVSSDDESLLKRHRREIAIVFCDLRGFTAFAETAEPEEVMGALQEYHDTLGALIHQFEGTVGHFAGDGLMIFFNDPLPCPDPAARAAHMAIAMRQDMDRLTAVWRKRGHELGFGLGIAMGYATLGQIGFEGRFDYSAIGVVVNLASRLCSEARPGQIVVSQRVYAAAEELVEAERLPDLTLKGFHKPVSAFNLIGLRM